MQLFRFANPAFLYLLLLLPVMIILWILNERRKKKALLRFGNPELVKKLMPEYSRIRPNLKLFFSITALALIIIVLARPQFGSKLEEVKKQGVEVIIALDVSNSMLAEDIQPNRLERAKQALTRLIDNLENDKIGLIVFAGDAYIQIPVTTDYISAKMFLSTISPEMVPKQGTAIGSAIELGMRSFSPGEGKSKAMIIITDGENHEDDPVAAASEAAKAGIVIHTIGIGSVEGVPVPVRTGGGTDFLKDHDGNTVITKLDENTLKKIAVSASGKYVRASSTNIGLDEIFNEIKKMKKQELESTMYTEYNDQFRIFAILALIFLLAEFMIMDRKNRKMANISLFKYNINTNGGRLITICFIFLLPLPLYSQGDKKYIREGNREYEKGKYAEAEISYRRAVDKNSESEDAVFNIGDALYRQKKFEDAGKQFSENYQMNDDRKKKSASLYNLGNSLLMANKIKESIDAYKGSLKLDPGNMEAKYNLAYAQDLLNQQQQQQQEKQDQNKDNKENKEQQDQKSNEDQQQKQEQDQQQQQQKQQAQQQQEISKEDAERILNALANDEKEVQEKVKLAKARKEQVKILRNW